MRMERASFLALSLWLCLAVLPALLAAATDAEAGQAVEVNALNGLQGRRSLSSYGYGKGRSMTCTGKAYLCRKRNKWTNKPHCCRGKCVNKREDNVNCGKCGKVCNYGKTCCRGKCTDLKKDRKNCGKCGNKCERPYCKKGRRNSYGKKIKCPKAKCNYGSCNYGYGHGGYVKPSYKPSKPHY